MKTIGFTKSKSLHFYLESRKLREFMEGNILRIGENGFSTRFSDEKSEHGQYSQPYVSRFIELCKSDNKKYYSKTFNTVDSELQEIY